MSERLTAAQYRALGDASRRHKYGAKAAFRCTECGAAAEACGQPCRSCGAEAVIRIDSRAEARRYDQLRAMERIGLISKLERQVPYPIEVNGLVVARLIVDFRYRDRDGRLVVEDVKSPATLTPVARLKIKLVEAIHGVSVEIVGV